jgi:hypothetical protein
MCLVAAGGPRQCLICASKVNPAPLRITQTRWRRGRILLSQGKPTEAIQPLQRAATINPLLKYQWILADALEAGRSEAAAEVESSLMRTGALNDPRTFALYLAAVGQQLQEALRLAQEELNTRADIFTMDALTWALKSQWPMCGSPELLKEVAERRDQGCAAFLSCRLHRDGQRRLRLCPKIL